MEIRKKNNVKVVFVLYIICLLNFVVVKYFGNIGRVAERVRSILANRNEGFWNIELRPSILSTIDYYLKSSLFDIVTLYFLFNILIFIPLGFLLPLLAKKPSLLKTLRNSIVIILSIECIQFVTCLGVFDVDDIILNMVGSVMGYAIWGIYTKISLVIERSTKAIY